MTRVEVPRFLQEAPDTSVMLDAPSGRWLVIEARAGFTWMIDQEEWRCIRFNITEEDMING